MRDTSLIYPVNEKGEILLGHKRRGMGYGKWNGFGGKIEPGETMRQCAVRELREESGLVADEKDLELVGDLYFDCPDSPEWAHAGIVYFVRRWKGTPALSDEMEPRWFALENLPYDDMWQADCRWLPMVLSGKKIRGVITFAADGDTVTDIVLEEEPVIE
jgi:mutator protein MutT